MSNLFRCSVGEGKISRKLVGTLSGGTVTHSGKIDIHEILPNYKNLTANNFIMELKGVNGGGYNGGSASAFSELNYDPTTGVITCTGIGCRESNGWSGGGATIDVYYIYVR